MRLFCSILCCASAIASSVAGAPARPQPAAVPQATICTTLKAMIDADLKETSAQTIREITENSAPRATVEEAKISVELLEVEANLILMGQHHCAPYDGAITAAAYMAPATACEADRMKGVLAGQTATPETCNRETWVRFH